MVRVSARVSRPEQSDGERVFADDEGRRWVAGHTGEALVFTCVSDARQSARAIDIAAGEFAGTVGEETLREWLSAAPRIGMLT